MGCMQNYISSNLGLRQQGKLKTNISHKITLIMHVYYEILHSHLNYYTMQAIEGLDYEILHCHTQISEP